METVSSKTTNVDENGTMGRFIADAHCASFSRLVAVALHTHTNLSTKLLIGSSLTSHLAPRLVPVEYPRTAGDNPADLRRM